jgi:serine/threonine protein kinase/Flp pilus assembly protein TadD
MNEPVGKEIEIFSTALRLASAAERAAYLERSCAGDGSLRKSVEALLDAVGVEYAEESGGRRRDLPVGQCGPTGGGPEGTVVMPAIEKPGDRIGRYKILQQIGEGGCGVVYMAEQEQPVRRRVALKVIKLGMDTKAVIARFEAERQALALMDHPNIAKVLDAGATETGRPFFIMELVRGVRITDYCDEARLPARDRLDLFIQICHAIQHAHQKGIIHRDLKPSNVLVTVNDGIPVPKVIDFGIAKATTDQRLTDKTLFTAYEQFIGTPAYMSPEQAVMTSLDVDTRSDIYSLGVLLYELLTGETPFNARELLASGLDEMRRTIREKEPDRPSTRLGTMTDADVTTVAKRRQLDVPRLIHLLRGDLDWIVMKAIEKDRTRRYQTASALAADVQRYLANETVEARPPSSLYRFQKLVRRNKTVFAAAGAVVLALVIGLGLSLYALAQEKQARLRAVAAEKEQAQMRQDAEEAAALGRKLTVAGMMLSQGKFDEAEQIMSQVPAHPATAALFNVLGNVHAQRGEWQACITNFSKVVQFIPSEHVAYHYLAPLLVEMGDLQAYYKHRERTLRQFAGTADPAIAERMAKDCLILPPAANEWEGIDRMVETALAAGPEHKLVAYFQFVKGMAEFRHGRYASAEEWLQKVVNLPAHQNRKVQSYMLLAMAQQKLGRAEEARATLREGIEFAEARLPKPGRDRMGDDWHDWIIAQILMREARKTVEGKGSNQ